MPAIGALDCSGDFPGGAVALHRNREHIYRYTRAAPPQYREDVVNRRSGRGGHHPQPGNACGQCLFARGIKQSLGQQPCLEFFEGGLQGACAGLLQVFHNQLELAAALV